MSHDIDEQAAREAHIEAASALRALRAAWRAEDPAADLPARIRSAAPDPAVAGLCALYVFAARVGGARAEDPEVAERWLTGWSAARGRSGEEARDALDAAIAFARRLHSAMGIDRPE